MGAPSVGPVSIPNGAPVPNDPASAVTAKPAQRPREMTEAQAFRTALVAIARDHIEGRPTEESAVLGAMALTRIDPALGLKRDGNRMVLTHEGRPVGSAIFPPFGRGRGWYASIAHLADAARSVSDRVRASSPQQVFQAVMRGVASDLDAHTRFEPPTGRT